MKVLIAEDDPISRRRLEGMLVKWGYEVTAAGDGIKALQVFRENPPPSLAILDWIMPGMDGTEVCRKVREMSDHRSSYIILFATRNFLESIVDGSEKGADDYLAKPVDFEELRARLQRAMHILDLRQAFASGPLSTL
jgi:DNA-binding response OmpR family regulator